MNSKYLILSALFLALMTFVCCPKKAQAEAAWVDLSSTFFANVDVGWNILMLKNNDLYEEYNHGFNITISAGGSALYFFGLEIDQELGFIELQHKGDSSRNEKLFKGATFFTYPISYPVKFDDSFLLFQAKLGLGVVYMQAPKINGNSMQTWFGLRPSLAMAYMTTVSADHNGFGVGTSVGAGLDIGYTFCPAISNVYDHRSIVHFFGLAAKFIVTF